MTTKTLPVVRPEIKNPILVITRDKSGKSKTFTVDGDNIENVSAALREGLRALAEKQTAQA